MIDDTSQLDSSPAAAASPAANPFAAHDVEEILREKAWLRAGDADVAPDAHPARTAWLEEAATLLGPQAKSRDALADLLALIFGYDATTILATPDAQAVVLRSGSR